MLCLETGAGVLEERERALWLARDRRVEFAYTNPGAEWNRMLYLTNIFDILF